MNEEKIKSNAKIAPPTILEKVRNLKNKLKIIKERIHLKKKHKNVLYIYSIKF